jgi:Flp pilus assembly protein TadG
MKSNKGQALLEFILILPIFLMLFLGMFDFGRILYEKNRLENIMGDVVDMHLNNKTTEQINNFLELSYSNKITYVNKVEGKNKVLILNTMVNIFTPGLDVIIAKPYKVETRRVIYNE